MLMDWGEESSGSVKLKGNEDGKERTRPRYKGKTEEAKM
jgi:hypothetical protein